MIPTPRALSIKEERPRKATEENEPRGRDVCQTWEETVNISLGRAGQRGAISPCTRRDSSDPFRLILLMGPLP